jgi:hypothetical protein
MEQKIYNTEEGEKKKDDDERNRMVLFWRILSGKDSEVHDDFHLPDRNAV